MSFVLGTRSRHLLKDAATPIVKVVRRAIMISTVDFAVHETLRTVDRQRGLVASGASTTMNSLHLAGPDGLARAVDLVPYIEGDLRWDWPLAYLIAEAMQAAARIEAVPMVWGGVWDRSLNALGDMEDEVADYVARRRALGKRAFIDGPHFQLGMP